MPRGLLNRQPLYTPLMVPPLARIPPNEIDELTTATMMMMMMTMMTVII